MIEKKIGPHTLTFLSRIPGSVDRSSESYQRITAAGFTIEDGLPIGESIAYFFRCVCGKEEMGIISKEENIPYDIAGAIERAGGVSETHLRKDGYSEEDIKRIRAPYKGLSVDEGVELPLRLSRMRDPIEDARYAMEWEAA